jgi:hypothetical protein
MAEANTLSSTIAQIAAGLGVAIGALLLRAADTVLSTAYTDVDPQTGFQVAFVMIAVIMLFPALEGIFGLHRHAGSEVAAGR